MSLQGWFNIFEALSFISAATVISGLVLEYGKDLFKVVKFWEPGPHIAEIEVETFKKKRGSVLVVVGIFLELIATGGIAVMSDRIETQHRAEIAEIENAVVWRQLSPDQATKIASSLRKYAGQKVNVFAYNGDLEAWAFANQIELALGGKDGAGWNVYFARIIWSRLTTTGILVETTEKATDRDRRVAKDLLNALNSQGLAAVSPAPQFASGEDRKDELVEGGPGDAAIWITVGIHPRPQIKE
jgi:hypothetical protein